MIGEEAVDSRGEDEEAMEAERRRGKDVRGSS